MIKDIFEDNKFVLLISGILLLITILISLFITKSQSNKNKLYAKDVVVEQTMDFDNDFFKTVPVIEKKEEVIEKNEDLKPEPNFRKKIAEKITKEEQFSKNYEKESLAKDMKLKLLLAKQNRSSATQVWGDDERFENRYKNQPLYKIKQAREQKDVVNGAFSSIEEFCDYGEDCYKTTGITNLEHVIIKGTRIPLILTQKIVSDIPTTVCQAQVTQDVTGYHGSEILIPKNSIAICKVLPVTDASQERLQVVFTDIYTPNGVKIIGEFAGADVTGAEGLVGKVETRLIERVGFPLATAALPITMAYTLPASSTTDEDRMNSAIQSISQSLQPILNSELDRYINTMPRITIEAGTLLTIKPENDIVFKPHLGGKYIPTWQ